MIRTYCTYFDSNYLVKGLALIESLNRWENSPFRLFVVCLDDLTQQILEKLNCHNIFLISLKEIEAGDTALARARGNRTLVEYYWTLTPTVVLRFFKEVAPGDFVTYIDADLFFYSSPEPIFSEFAGNSVLIHEHRLSSSLKHLEVYGKYNVGLLCFRRDDIGLEVVKWWQERCNEWCYERTEDGKFGDQLYLNDWPERFRAVRVLENVGAGVAPWNQEQYSFGVDLIGRIMVDGVPLVFYHFHALVFVNEGVVLPAKHAIYPLPKEVVILCLTPYLDSLERAKAAIRKVIPDFSCGLVSKEIWGPEHTFVARKEFADAIKKLGINYPTFDLGNGWYCYVTTQLSHCTNKPKDDDLLPVHGDNDFLHHKTTHEIVVATSIAPTDIVKQQAAIVTWLHLGLRVLSLNNTDEIDLLKPHFPGVHFVPAARNAQEIVGIPLVYFDDILSALENSGAEFCGIINSDIHLRADEHFPDFIVQESRNSFIYGSRIDIASIDDTFGTELGTGFDFFFFDRAALDLYPQTVFSIGATWWDYWAVIVPLLKSYAVKKLDSPVAFHVDHAKNWSPDQWHYLGGLFSSHLSELGFTFSTVNLQSSVFMFLDHVDYVSPKLRYGPCETNRPAPGTYLVSAIVSTYNAEKFFRGCLQNLLDQTLYKAGKLEIIIINSGSQQNEGAIAREFISRFPQHVVYVRTERETLYEAWNRGISLAHGTYLTHANTDDRHRSDAFEVMAHVLDQNPAGLVYSDAIITQQANETFEQNSATQKWLLPDFNLRQALLDCPFGCQVMWRASAHEAVGLFDGSFKRAGDYEFFLRLALHQEALHLPEILTLYHESMSNLSYESPEEVFSEVTRFIGKVRREAPLELIYPFLSQDSSVAATAAAKMDFANHLMGSGGVWYTDFPLAVELYCDLREQFPDSIDLISNLFIAYIMNGQTDNAISLLESTPSLSPRLEYYQTQIMQGESPQITFTCIQHPGLSTMRPFKPGVATRIPHSNEVTHSGKTCKEAERSKTQPHGKSTENIRVLYDISVLGLSLIQEAARTGIFRVVEHVAQGLAKSPDISLMFCSTQSLIEHAPYTVDACRHYLALHPEFNHIPFHGTDIPEADIFHSPYHGLPDCVTTTVRFLTVYDLIPVLFPKLVSQQSGQRQYQMIKKLRNHDHCLCISQATQKDLCSFIGLSLERVYVSHLAADSGIFYPCTNLQQRLTIRQKYHIGTAPYILSLCTLEPRKNIDHVIRAFASLVRANQIGDTRLVLTGSKGWEFNQIVNEIDNSPELHKRIVLTGYVPDEDLAALYSEATVFVYMSFYEGFGLPPLEAMQCGIPVITSNTSSLPEVVGFAGIMLDPNDLDRLCRALQEVIVNPKLHTVMSQQSFLQASRFNWNHCVEETIAAYKYALCNQTAL